MTVIPMPDRSSSPTGLVAAEVRAELSRARIRPSHLVRLIGNSQTYWSRRVNGETTLDAEDLCALADLLGCSPATFFATWAPRGSNPQPTDYKSAPSESVVVRLHLLRPASESVAA